MLLLLWLVGWLVGIGWLVGYWLVGWLVVGGGGVVVGVVVVVVGLVLGWCYSSADW